MKPQLWGDEIGLSELAEAALLRVPTLGKLQLVPVPEVIGFWNQDLLGHSRPRRLTATPSHNILFARLITDLELCGNDVNDAWLAALAIDHRAILVCQQGQWILALSRSQMAEPLREMTRNVEDRHTEHR